MAGLRKPSQTNLNRGPKRVNRFSPVLKGDAAGLDKIKSGSSAQEPYGDGMHDVVKRPSKGWQLYFQPLYWYPGTPNPRLTGIRVVGVSRHASPPASVTLQENIEFCARIRFSYSARGSSCAVALFEDTESGKPYIYRMSSPELVELFRGIQTGQFPVSAEGMDVRLTFVKKGSAVFARPVLL